MNATEAAGKFSYSQLIPLPYNEIKETALWTQKAVLLKEKFLYVLFFFTN